MALHEKQTLPLVMMMMWMMMMMMMMMQLQFGRTVLCFG
jgi:hypothetical protein